jgi:hypothetical protein
LWIEYAALSQQFEAHLDRIAAFSNSTVRPIHRERILERTSFSFMKRHESKFEPRITPSTTGTSQDGAFLYAGTTGGWRALLTDGQIRAFEAKCISVGLTRWY